MIRNGKVVDVRESLREMLSGGSAGASSCGRASTEVVCTESVQEMQDRLVIVLYDCDGDDGGNCTFPFRKHFKRLFKFTLALLRAMLIVRHYRTSPSVLLT